MRPKLRTFITEVYKDVSYVLDDDSYSNAEYQDVVRKRFIKLWDALMDDYKVRSLLLCSVFYSTMYVRIRLLILIFDYFSGSYWTLYYALGKGL